MKKQKLCRRFGVSLWGKQVKRNYKPGVHGPTSGYNKLTDYGIQLRGKRMMQEYYGLKEYQFRNLYSKAMQKRGDTAQNMIALLESSMKVLVYRSNLASSVFAARQLISHKHFLLNGKAVNISTHVIKPGDVVSVRDKSKNLKIIAESVAKKELTVPPYIEVSPDGMSATFLRIPSVDEVPYPFTPELNAVIEYYS